MTDKNAYIVNVDTGGSSYEFTTHHKGILHNIMHGNTRHVFFITTDGVEVMIPDRFMVVVRPVLDDQPF